MEMPIIYEDDYIVAIDKPSGVMTHPDGRNAEDVTASDWFAHTYPASANVGEMQRLQPVRNPETGEMTPEEIMRPGVVHRLDRETSGVLMFAKTPEAHAFYKKAFQEHEARKTYLAFVYGVMSEPRGSIDFSIGRSRKDFRLRSAQPKAKGTLREALTRFEVISNFGTHAFLKVMPVTGRTHQIRVHMKAIHHPIVCDKLYAPNHACDLGFDRLGLHAYELNIPLMNAPQDAELESLAELPRISVHAPLPKDLTQAAAKFPNTEIYR